MITPSKIESEIRNFRDLLIEKQLVIASNPIAIKSLGSLSRVTWHSSVVDRPPATDFTFASISEYCCQLATNAYTVVLFEGSIIQISIDVRHTEIVGHRFCFYPCPFDLEPDDLSQLPILDVIKLYDESRRDLLRLRSPLRFEFDLNNASDNHPLCHVHFLWAHCRCSVVAPLSLGHFIKFVFLHFFPGVWDQNSFLREWPTVLGTRTISIEQEKTLHLACRR